MRAPRLTYFGRVKPTNLPDDYKNFTEEEKAKAKLTVKESKDHLTKGTNRVKEKVKELRQNFSKAVISGTRSGSGKIVFEHYDKFTEIWGGSPNVSQLSFGLSTSLINNQQNIDSGITNREPGFTSSDTSGDCELNTNKENMGEENSYLQDASNSGIESETSTGSSESGGVAELQSPTNKNNMKRKPLNNIPRLVDNKRKHLEKRLSAAQREQIFLNESKEDAQFKKDMAEAIRESNKTFADSIKAVGQSLTDIGTAKCRSIEALSKAMQPSFNQNVLYHRNHQTFAGQPPGMFTSMLNQPLGMDLGGFSQTQGESSSSFPYFSNENQ